MGREHFKAAHQYVEEPLARRLSRICAARMASIAGNVPRSSESDTRADLAISAKPIRSIGFSASSVMNASMIRSRSDLLPRDAGRAADLREVLRAMAELLNS